MDALATCRNWLIARGAQDTFGKHRLQASVDRVAKAKALALAASLVEIEELLCDVEHVFLKGPVLSQALYGDPAARACHDIDVLVRDVPEALTRLQAAGYQPLYPVRHEDSRVRSGTNAYPMVKDVLVEVHWDLFPPKTVAKAPDLLSVKQVLHVGETLVPAPAGPQALYHLVLHGATSAYRRLLWLSDVLQWLDLHPEHADPVSRQAHRDGHARSLAITAACLERIRPGAAPSTWSAGMDSWADRIEAGWLQETEYPWRNTTDSAYQVWLRGRRGLSYAWWRIAVPGFDDALRDPDGDPVKDRVLRPVRKLLRIGKQQGSPP